MNIEKMVEIGLLFEQYKELLNIEKMVEIGLLFEQYKELLTDKQREIVSLYYEEDYSLGEISENLNVSRQGVYDTLKRSEKILKDYEDKLKLVYKIQQQEKFIKTIEDKIVDKQREIVSLYYEEDYSLGEISENLNVSRQGVYDTLKRSEKILKDYEEKLKLVYKIQQQEKFIKTIEDKIVDIKQDLLQNKDCASATRKVYKNYRR